MLTTVRRNGSDKHGRFTWECRCSCGAPATATATNLRTGEVKSCGCLARAGRPAHGHKRQSGGSRSWSTWSNMKQRCTNPKMAGWSIYGGRGIRYVKRWEKFANFLADMGERPAGMTLDRRNNDGNYSKANCRWATPMQQRMNSRAPLRWVTLEGEKMHLTEAVRRFSKVSYGVVCSRIHRGWSELDAIMRPRSHRWARTKVAHV